MSKKWGVLLGTSLAALMIGIDFTIVNTLLSNIQTELNASINQLQWIMAGFGITFGALLIISGRLGDLVGHKKILYLSMFGFALASLGAGFANTPWKLIIMRMLQGLLGAGIIPSGMAQVANVFAKAEQGRALGIYNSIVGVGLALGPVLGSIIDCSLNWRWIFFINVPIMMLSLLICLLFAQESKRISKIKINWLGAIFLILLLVILNFILHEGLRLGWTSKIMIAAMSALLSSILGLYFSERKALMPIIPLHLITNREFGLALTVYGVSAAFAWSILFLMPLYLHEIAGYSTTLTGVILASMTLMTLLAPGMAGYCYDKKSKTMTIHILFGLVIISLFLFSLLKVQGSLSLIIISLVLFGFAWGMGNGIAMPIALSNWSTSAEAGSISGALTTAMNILAIFTLVVITALFNHKQLSWFENILNKQSIDATVAKQFSHLLSQPGQLYQLLAHTSHFLTEQVIAAYKLSFTFALHFVYGVLLMVALTCWWWANKLMKHQNWG